MAYTSSLGMNESQPGKIALGWNRCLTASAHTSLEMEQGVDLRLDYLTAFDLVIPLSGLNADSQGEHALVLAFFQYAARYADRRDARFTNPFSEVLHQLERVGVSAHAVTYLRRFLNTAEDAYSRR
jgi:hypothetical protein